MLQVREQYELMSKKNQENSKTKPGKHREKDNQDTEKQSQPTSSTSASVSTPDKIVPNPVHSEKSQSDSAAKAVANKTELSTLKTQSTFNLESEIAKIKISVPLSELATQDVYKGQILKALNLGENNDTVNLNDDQPALLFGPKIEGKFQEGVVPPFYISLNIHEKILHNAMHDSGALHNLMPKVVMERLGLEITQPYKIYIRLTLVE